MWNRTCDPQHIIVNALIEGISVFGKKKDCCWKKSKNKAEHVNFAAEPLYKLMADKRRDDQENLLKQLDE